MRANANLFEVIGSREGPCEVAAWTGDDALTAEDYDTAVRHLASLPYLPWAYTTDGCYARATYYSMLLATKGAAESRPDPLPAPDDTVSAESTLLELVAEKNPYTMTAGQVLPVQLTYQARPLAGALVVAMQRDDPAKKISAADWHALEQALVLSPSSVAPAGHVSTTPSDLCSNTPTGGCSLWKHSTRC